MTTGTVKWFSIARKYGFIVPDEGGKDVFVHMSALATAALPDLDDGTRVSFDLEQMDNRRSAVNLTLIEPERAAHVEAAQPAVIAAAAVGAEPAASAAPVAD